MTRIVACGVAAGLMFAVAAQSAEESGLALQGVTVTAQRVAENLQTTKRQGCRDPAAPGCARRSASRELMSVHAALVTARRISA